MGHNHVEYEGFWVGLLAVAHLISSISTPTLSLGL